MKTLCIATVLALLAGSAAQAGSIIDGLFKESGVKIDDKSITVGDQKFDVDSILNGLGKLMKEATKERAESPSRRDDAASSQTDDPAAPRTVWRSDDHAAPRTDAQPSVSTPAKDNAVRASTRRSR